MFALAAGLIGARRGRGAEHVLSDAGSRTGAVAHARITTVVLEGPAQFEQWSHASTLPDLHRAILLDPSELVGTSDVVQQSYSQTLRNGAALLSERPNTVAERMWRIRPDDTATIISTSGTNAAPDAMPLTHRNVLAVVSGTEEIGHIPAPYRAVGYLPRARPNPVTAHLRQSRRSTQKLAR